LIQALKILSLFVNLHCKITHKHTNRELWDYYNNNHKSWHTLW
jgi:hypothetical protein